MFPRPRAAAPVPLAALLAALLAGAGPAHAQIAASLNRSGSGARAAGMGNAFVAVSDDGTAASWNPAGLAQLRKPEFSLVFALERQELSFTGMRSADGTIAYSNRQLHSAATSPDFFSAALPLTLARRPVTVQLGWQRIYQLESESGGEVSRLSLGDPAATAERIFLVNASQGAIDRGSLSVAVKLAGWLSLGGSFNVWRGDWTDQVGFVEPAGASSDFLIFDEENRIRGENVTLGALFTSGRLNVGFVYNTPFWSSYRLHQDSQSNRRPPRSYDGGDDAEFRFPSSLGVGLAWRPAPRWTVALDVSHDQWTDTLVRGLAERPQTVNFFDAMPPEFSTTRDTTSINVGGEHLFLREGSVIPLRMGLGWEPQGGMDPVTRDPVDLFLFAAGAGYNTNSLKFDAAVQYRWGGIRVSDVYTVTSALTGARDAFGHSRAAEWRFKVSAIYRIP
jgi:long-subunit fatty acid transport protein